MNNYYTTDQARTKMGVGPLLNPTVPLDKSDANALKSAKWLAKAITVTFPLPWVLLFASIWSTRFDSQLLMSAAVSGGLWWALFIIFTLVMSALKQNGVNWRDHW